MTLFVGFLSYRAFGENTQPIVLYNMPEGRWYSVLAQTAYMFNIMGCFCLNTPVLFNLFEKDDQHSSPNLILIPRRIAAVLFILLLSIALPNINLVLSLFAGSICGTLLLILPVFFYRAAYLNRPSKKDRSRILKLGWVLVASAVPIGVLGIA